MNCRFPCALALAAVMAGAAATAHAADYTLTVPVDVSNLPPEVYGGSVSCQILNATYRPDVSPESARMGYNGEPNLISQSPSFPFPVNAGAYRGNVVVTANAVPGADPARGTAYGCHIALRARVGGSEVNYFAGTIGSLSNLPVAAGTVLHVYGSIR